MRCVIDYHECELADCWDPTGTWAGRGKEAGLVGDAGADGFGHGVVDGEDGVFGDVGAGLGVVAILVGDAGAFDVFAFDDGKSFHDVLDRVARRGNISCSRGLSELPGSANPDTDGSRRLKVEMCAIY
jgi:hypothetical protein